MGATISSLEVQSFHPGDSYKINTNLLPAQHIVAANHNARPKRTPSSPVKGRPLIFAAMTTVEDSPSEKAEYDPYRSYGAYPSPPSETVMIPPRVLTGESETGLDFDFSRWDEQQQPRSIEHTTPQTNGNAPLPPASTPRLSGNAQLPPPQFLPEARPQTPPRAVAKRERKNSSPRLRPTAGPPGLNDPSPPAPHSPRTLTKTRPTTPQRKMSSAALQQPSSPPIVGRDLADRTASRASTLMLDDDPFAKVEGVRVLKPASRDGPPAPAPPPLPSSADSPPSPTRTERAVPESPTTPQQESFDAAEPQNTISTPPQKTSIHNGNAPPSPVTPEEYRNARSRRRGDHLEKAPPSSVAGIGVRETRIPGPFPLAACIANPQLLSALLMYLSFSEWCILSAVTKQIRMRLVQSTELREVALERYLRTVGYSRWVWNDPDPLELSLLVRFGLIFSFMYR
ncbi:hypothetical protein DFH07DRAFT_546230 [Mycena maculata]|uniref:Uncharacterized protein n=1 Tax=Mycena maculata TaxID=230809 RepID=A0AAD7N7S0_9AGAR|nr:hypothetical protein DFH07DRAFT_546230 [Mycena maculata]